MTTVKSSTEIESSPLLKPALLCPIIIKVSLFVVGLLLMGVGAASYFYWAGIPSLVAFAAPGGMASSGVILYQCLISVFSCLSSDGKGIPINIDNSSSPKEFPLPANKGISRRRQMTPEKATIFLFNALKNSDEISIQNIKNLMAKGANVNALNEEGKTPIDCLIEKGQSANIFQVLWILLEARAQISEEQVAVLDEEQNNILHKLAEADDPSLIPLIKFLIEKFGSSLFLYNKEHETPLHMAILCNSDLSIIKCFLPLIEDVNAKNEEGETLLSYMLKIEDLEDVNAAEYVIEIVKFLFEKGADLSKQEATELLFAVMRQPNLTKNTDLIVELIEKKGADIQAKDLLERTPLHYSFIEKSTKKIPLRVFAAFEQADFNAQDYEGNTPVHLMVTAGFVDVCQHFIDLDADFNKPNNEGKTPFYLALVNLEWDIVQKIGKKHTYLFEKVNDQAKNTAFHIVAGIKIEHVQDTKVRDFIHSFIKQFKLSPLCLNKQNKTAIHIALENENFYFIEYCLSYLFDEDKSSLSSCLSILIDAIPDVADENVDKLFSIIKWWLEKGADLSQEKATDLLLEVVRFSPCDVDLVKILIQKGADVNVQDEMGRGPLYHLVEEQAKHKNQGRALEVIAECVKAGANLLIKDNCGETLLHIAAFYGLEKIVCYLLEAVGREQATDYVKTPNQRDETPLDLAIFNAWPVIIGMFYCCSISLKDKDNNTILHRLAELPPTNDKAKIERICALSAHFTSIGLFKPAEDLNKDKKTALDLAVIHGNAHLVKAWLPCLNSESPCIKTLLHEAVMNPQKKIIRLLLEKEEIDVNLPNQHEHTPLYLLFKKGKEKLKDPEACESIAEIARMLIKCDAFFDSSRMENSPRAFLKRKLTSEEFKQFYDMLLFDTEDKLPSSLYLAADQMDLENFGRLLKEGASVKICVSGYSPLSVLAIRVRGCRANGLKISDIHLKEALGKYFDDFNKTLAIISKTEKVENLFKDFKKFYEFNKKLEIIWVLSQEKKNEKALIDEFEKIESYLWKESQTFSEFKPYHKTVEQRLKELKKGVPYSSKEWTIYLHGISKCIKIVLRYQDLKKAFQSLNKLIDTCPRVHIERFLFRYEQLYFSFQDIKI